MRDEDEITIGNVLRKVKGGNNINLDLRDSLLSASIRETIDGAPEFRMVIHDPDHELMKSDVLFVKDRDGDRHVRPLDVALDADRWYRLVKVGWRTANAGRGIDLTLVFEHRIVSYLRAHRKPRKVSRSRSTLAQFMQTFAREVKADQIRFVSRDLTKRQPIEKTRAEQDEDKDPGLASDAIIKVKGRRATTTQKRVIEQVLQAGDEAKVEKDLLIVAIMVITQESVAGTKNVSASGKHFGPFHQDSSYGTEKQRRDPTHAATEFFDRAVKFKDRHPEAGLAGIAEGVQISGEGAKYDQWRDEARDTVESFSGTGFEAARRFRKQYNYERGLKDGRRESSWDCSQRYARLVGWRSFVVGRATWYFESEPNLFKARARLTITQGHPSVVSLSGDVDENKTERTISARVRIDKWVAPAGTVVIVDGYGVADGRWLVETIERDFFDPEASVRLKKPTKPKPEPSAESGTRPGEDPDEARGGGLTARLYREAKKISDAGGPYVYGGGHGPLLRELRIGKAQTRRIHQVGQNKSEPYDESTYVTSSDYGLDCSSSTALALWRSDMFPGERAIVSGEFARSWGRAGKGKEFTVWANSQHVWIEFHDQGRFKRFDTSPHGSGGRGPRMRTGDRPSDGFTPRHWPGH